MIREITYQNNDIVLLQDRLKELSESGLAYKDIKFYDANTGSLITGDISEGKYRIKKETQHNRRIYFHIYEEV